MVDLHDTIKMWRDGLRRRRHAGWAHAAATGALAADLPTTKEPLPVLAVDTFQPFYVKFGCGLCPEHQQLAPLWPIGQPCGQWRPLTLSVDVGATLSNVVTANFVAGVFVNPNLSFEIATGIPAYVSIKTNGYNPFNPTLTNGTKLGEGLLSFVPMTAVYHFNQFGSLQPYLGAGLTPVFSFGNKNGFLTGITVPSSVGGVLQAGADYMIDRHWGVNVDVRKIFTYAEINRRRRLVAAGCLRLQHAAYQLSAMDVRLGPRLPIRRVGRRGARGRQILSLLEASGLRVSNPRRWRGFSFALRRSILAG